MNSKTSDSVPEARTLRSGAAASIGAQLRSAREAQGVTLRQISEQTRIQMRYLEAIESDNFQQLPGGIFNRSFIKAYAKQVNFNEDEALEAYSRTAREQGTPTDEEMPTSYQPRVYTNGDSARNPWVNLLLVTFILGIISIGAYALQHWYNRRAETNAPAATQNSATVPAPQPTPAPVAQGLTVSVKAVNQPVWMRVQADDGSTSEFTLRPSDAARELSAQNRVRLQYARVNARYLEVMINNRPARVTAEGAANPVEMIITTDNYQQLLQ